MSLQKGDIVLVPFPFTDLRETKLRPGLVLWVDGNGNDVTLCFISSQNVTKIAPEEFILDTSDSDFATTGLRVISKVRVTRIVTVEQRLITRRIGKLAISQLQQLNTVMSQAFQLT
ncbi:type II toxin-antitoxin system PemK/MazF family toxin [Halotia branconii]|uniref:Type II toxin-antitoxin system PemK/MazF family toxin n=1 Tax=Halotia branconii CENA392 TaxID=1539056 RepID=A0AAJ6NTW4_9CYAN|nr:type II toxin-antitoxin system PemK/MazF family toxin [Halotia branconii]WGV26436.1 type II toxin-antitoxin system PemK/MazF family toxin [Halotia branconii CENA392]